MWEERNGERGYRKCDRDLKDDMNMVNQTCEQPLVRVMFLHGGIKLVSAIMLIASFIEIPSSMLA